MVWISRDRYRALCRDIAAQGQRIARIERALAVAIIDISKIKAAAERAEAGFDSVMAVLREVRAQQKALADKLAEAIAAQDPAAIQAIQTELDKSAGELDDKVATAIAEATTQPPAG